MKTNNLISGARLLSAAAMLAQASEISGPVFHNNNNMSIGHFLGGGSRHFNLSYIMHVRKNNQRNKNQKRIKGGALK